jgi:hypothetical protein
MLVDSGSDVKTLRAGRRKLEPCEDTEQVIILESHTAHWQLGPNRVTRAEPLELCDESVARTAPSQYNPERRETSKKEIQPLLRHVHGCIRVSRSRSIPGVSSASVRINKCYVSEG